MLKVYLYPLVLRDVLQSYTQLIARLDSNWVWNGFLDDGSDIESLLVKAVIFCIIFHVVEDL